MAKDERKVRSVLDWLQPATLKELQRFLGFAQFYRRFIRDFSSVASPLTYTMKINSSDLTWSPAAVEAFTELISRHTSAPILHHPDPELQFIVEMDASNTGIGAILSQRHSCPPKLHPCTYFYHKLSSAEQNYDFGNRQLLAMKSAMEEWRHWLDGSKHPFVVLTDHKNLEYQRSAKRLNPRQARWALFFTRFDVSVTYRPGSKNTKADDLSRQQDCSSPSNSEETLFPESLIVAPVQWDIMTELDQVNLQEPSPPECPLTRPLFLRNSEGRLYNTSTLCSALVTLGLLRLSTFSRKSSGGQP